jgi:hypothetical protein
LGDDTSVPEVPSPSKVFEPSLDVERPTPEAELTPDQKKIRDLEHRLAQAETKKFDTAAEELDELGEDGSKTILIHILKDGFTALDRVWYRGQEIEFEVGGRAHEQTKDRTGQSWLAFDEGEQMRRWGDVMFRRGPWPGSGWADTAAAEAERKRARRAPVIK